jgi:transcriptional regulator of acetoin/glycerol metabolism
VKRYEIVRRPRNADKIIEVTQSSSAAARSPLAASWRRSVLKHGLDPDETRATNRVEQSDLENRRTMLDKFMTVASPRLDTPFSLGSRAIKLLETVMLA